MGCCGATGGSAGPGLSPSWVKVTKTFADFAAAALSNSITGYVLPAGGVLHATQVKQSAAFGGGGAAAYTVSVGIPGNDAKYATAFNVFQAPGNTVMQLSGTLGVENHGATTNITFTATSDVLLNLAAAGSVDIWLLVSVPG